MPVVSLVIIAALYGVGLVRLWRSAGRGRGISRGQAIAFAGGWLALAAALLPPLDEWSERWFAAHMLQHELLMVVAAPLMAFGAPLIAALWAIPAQPRRRLVKAVQHRPLASAWNALASPACGFFLYGLALWLWHIPALYDVALAHEAVHLVQHLCFFGTASLFWWSLRHGRHGRAGYGAAVVYVFATAVHGGLLGALLTFAPRLLYAPYANSHPFGLSPLEDQQLAGLLMWIPAGLTFAAGGLWLFAAWIQQSERRSRFPAEPALRPTQLR